MLLSDRGGGVDDLLGSFAQLRLELLDQLPLFFGAHLAAHFLILEQTRERGVAGSGSSLFTSYFMHVIRIRERRGEIGKGGEGRFGTGRILLNSNRKI